MYVGSLWTAKFIRYILHTIYTRGFLLFCAIGNEKFIRYIRVLLYEILAIVLIKLSRSYFWADGTIFLLLWFQHLTVSLKRLTLHLEEKWLWKMMQFVGQTDRNSELDFDENDYCSQKWVENFVSARKCAWSLDCLVGRASLSFSPENENPHLIIYRSNCAQRKTQIIFLKKPKWV